MEPRPLANGKSLGTGSVRRDFLGSAEELGNTEDFGN
jgi:hypothetical protein